MTCPPLSDSYTPHADIDVLNFALTLEYLEATFYHDALEKFSVDDFAAAGYPASVRSRFIEVAAHEKTHVEGIVGVIKGLKGTPTAKCTYNFPYKDPVGFVGLSAALETIGSSGYSGAAQFITDKAYLTVAASILSVESRHSSWVDGSVQGHNPWSGPFEVTLTPNQVFTLANGFIASCPSTNPPLPAKANPTLALSEGACPGAIATLTYDGTSSGVFLVFLTSNGPVSTPIHNDKTAKIPDGLKGTLFAFVSKAKDKADDENVVAGPALIMWPYDSEGNLIAQH
ncbi:hypothetical protein Moror_13076 [Moniliophthora roreri MCA 2997]|uniref:Stress response protein rds1p n=2 Tax=Moniliophthora roreri TaxID=221103 RepID=V2XLU4_MONRO|nr:hypothetical protein Moror_13076 [Moniliophthora roreri MCA 2997]